MGSIGNTVRFAQEGNERFEGHLQTKTKEAGGSMAVLTSGAPVEAFQGEDPSTTKRWATVAKPEGPVESNKQSRSSSVKCYLCHRRGHKAKDCRLRKQIIQDRKEKQKLAKDKEAGKIFVVAGTQIIAATECKVEDQIYSVALDTCATINAVTEEAARRMGYVRGRKDQAVETIGHNLDLDEVIRLRIDLRNVHSDIEAHIVPSAPVDILLGQEILNRFSKGFRMMQNSGRNYSSRTGTKERKRKVML